MPFHSEKQLHVEFELHSPLALQLLRQLALARGERSTTSPSVQIRTAATWAPPVSRRRVQFQHGGGPSQWVWGVMPGEGRRKMGRALNAILAHNRIFRIG